MEYPLGWRFQINDLNETHNQVNTAGRHWYSFQGQHDSVSLSRGGAKRTKTDSLWRLSSTSWSRSSADKSMLSAASTADNAAVYLDRSGENVQVWTEGPEWAVYTSYRSRKVLLQHTASDNNGLDRRKMYSNFLHCRSWFIMFLWRLFAVELEKQVEAKIIFTH